jgi:hypothetical protein
MKTKAQRIHLFFIELDGLEPASTTEGAIFQVERVLDQIEDKYSEVPYNRSNWGTGERMYLPPLSVVVAWKITGDFKRADLSGNYFYIHADGSMACADSNTAVVKWAKQGKNSFNAPKVGSVHPDKATWSSQEESKIDSYLADALSKIQPYAPDEDSEDDSPPEQFESKLKRFLKKILNRGRGR